MFIEKLWAKNKALEWEIDEIHFAAFNLLVGASGVGKTRILRAMMALTQQGIGHSSNGLSWDLTLREQGYRFRWKGVTDYKEEEPYSSLSVPPVVLEEEVFCDGEQIFSRSYLNGKHQIVYKGNPIPPLTVNSTAIHLIQEKEFQTMWGAFLKVNYSSMLFHPNFDKPFEPEAQDLQSIEAIRESRFHIFAKLYYAQQSVPEVFEQIKLRYSEIFPQVEDLQMVYIKPPTQERSWPMPFVQIRHSGVRRWIPQEEMSAGMKRSLLHLAQIYLCPKDSLIIIDEFENSLGVNCIDEVLKDMQTYRQDLQFIVTSHHPYIINAIDYQDWMLVTRKGGKIATHQASEFNLGKSRHKAFTQLVNLEAYQTGRMPEEEESHV